MDMLFLKKFLKENGVMDPVEFADKMALLYRNCYVEDGYYQRFDYESRALAFELLRSLGFGAGVGYCDVAYENYQNEPDLVVSTKGVSVAFKVGRLEAYELLHRHNASFYMTVLKEIDVMSANLRRLLGKRPYGEGEDGDTDA